MFTRWKRTKMREDWIPHVCMEVCKYLPSEVFPSPMHERSSYDLFILFRKKNTYLNKLEDTMMNKLTNRSWNTLFFSTSCNLFAETNTETKPPAPPPPPPPNSRHRFVQLWEETKTSFSTVSSSWSTHSPSLFKSSQCEQTRLTPLFAFWPNRIVWPQVVNNKHIWVVVTNWPTPSKIVLRNCPVPWYPW